MKKKLFLVFLICGSLTLHAQNWSKLTISPSGSSIVDIYFTDSSTGYGVGNSGIILKTNNGGTSWTQQSSGTTQNLKKVCFPSANVGYTIGMSGTILKTVSGGTTWTPQISGTSNTLNDIKFVDENIGYVVGDYGTVLKTIDGGSNWSTLDISSTNYLSKVFFIDSNNGYIFDTGGSIYKTTNGGTTWTTQTVSDFPSTILFTSTNIGYWAGSFGAIYKTINGGATWSKQDNSSTSVALNSICFRTDNTGYAVGANGTLLKTYNGATWTQQTSGTTENLYCVCFPTPNAGYILGSTGTLLKTIISTDLNLSTNAITIVNKQNFEINSNTSWTTSSNQNWLTLNCTSGTGNSTITATATTNTTSAIRTATITVSTGTINQTIVVTQQVPSLSLSQFEVGSDYSVSTKTFTITSNINWTISNIPNWVTLSQTSGTGNAVISVTFTANTSTSSRSLYMQILGTGLNTYYLEVYQNGFSYYLTVDKDYAVLPQTVSVLTFNISSNSSWTITDIPNWMKLNRTTGFGNATITVTTSENTTSYDRGTSLTTTGLATSLGRTCIWQKGLIYKLETNPYTYSYSPNINASTQIITFNIISDTTWTIHDIPDWIKLDKTSGSKNATIVATISANTITKQRSSVMRVLGPGDIYSKVYIYQNGIHEILNLSPQNLAFGATNNNTINIEITSNTDWKIYNIPDWLTFSETSGSGNAIITATANQNLSSSNRSSGIQVSGVGGNYNYIRASQSAYGINLNVSSNTLIFDHFGGTQGIMIQSNVEWYYSAYGNIFFDFKEELDKSNQGLLLVTVKENTETTARTNTFEIYGTNSAIQYITIIQNGTLTDISEKETEKNRIYPNPTKNILCIDGLNNEIQVEVLDLTGRTILSSQTTNHQIDVRVLKSGMYILKIETKKGSTTKKFIKE